MIICENHTKHNIKLAHNKNENGNGMLTTTTREDQQSTSYIKLWPWTIKCANVSRKKPRKVDQHIFRPRRGRNQNQLPQGKAIESNGSILMWLLWDSGIHFDKPTEGCILEIKLMFADIFEGRSIVRMILRENSENLSPFVSNDSWVNAPKATSLLSLFAYLND